jgi:hypothetical protein
MILLSGGPTTFSGLVIVMCIIAAPILAIVSLICSYSFDTYFSKKQYWYKEKITGPIKFFYWIMMFIIFYLIFAGIISGFVVLLYS